MLTFLTSAKAFRGRTAIHQRNAIRSWTIACPGAEVILFGADEGTDAIAAEFGLRHIADVATSTLGTPRLDEIFRRGQAEAQNDIVCYINADIVVMPEFAPTVRRVVAWSPDVLVIGHRWDAPFDEPIEFSEGWEQSVRRHLSEHGRRSSTDALDFFVFRRGGIADMPAFIIGRPAWDNWLIMNARHTGKKIVDVSACVQVMHPDHDYRHVPQATGRAWEGPEADYNRSLARQSFPGFRPALYTIGSAGWIAGPHGIRRARTSRHLVWSLYVWAHESPLAAPIVTFRNRRVSLAHSASRSLRHASTVLVAGTLLCVTRPRLGRRFLRRSISRWCRRAVHGAAVRLRISKRV